MKAILQRYLILICIVCCFVGRSFAQDTLLAEKEGVSYKEMNRHLVKLYEDETDSSQEQLKLEIKALGESPREELISLALTYNRALGEENKADSIRQATKERYPLGLFAASEVFNSLFEKGMPAYILEERYFEFHKKFNVASFYENFQPLFYEGQATVLSQYIEEGNNDEAIALASKSKYNPFFPTIVSLLYNALDDEKKYETLLPLAHDAYIYTKGMANTESFLKDYHERELKTITAIYADVLYRTGSYQKASSLAQQLLSDTDYDHETTFTNVRTLAGSYIALDQKEEAFAVYDIFLKKHGNREKLTEEVKEVYTELYPEDDFDTYVDGLDEQAVTARLAQYREKMIKEKAPAFTLVNRDGDEVSLSDYKGKVVVLDFWATWCGPCISSFPGMQAVLNKYEADPEVEFLFIDTWERIENYKELVEEFMTKNEYTFHVLFDEMKDPSRSVVTAYGVTGIPTKYVIDKEGFIRFKSVGNSSYQIDDIVTDMESMITLVKEE